MDSAKIIRMAKLACVDTHTPEDALIRFAALIQQSLIDEGWRSPEIKAAHGCHCDIESMDEGFQPDGCVLDDGSADDCIYATKLVRDGKGKESCEYWKPITIHPRKERKLKLMNLKNALKTHLSTEHRIQRLTRQRLMNCGRSIQPCIADFSIWMNRNSSPPSRNTES